MLFKNPIIPGYNPDPSICRVGSDYYIVNSTFEFFPGVPVYHSKNLVNWELTGYCLDRRSQLELEDCRNSGGIYAPTIRYHKGMFYMITTNVTDKGNFVVHTEDINSEWSEPAWIDQGGIDPSLFFDDDKCYYCSTGIIDGVRGIVAFEINPLTGVILSEKKLISEGCGGQCPEGPHIYKKDGWYYLMIAEGGTEYAHRETIQRSHNVYGPYEACPDNPVISHKEYKKSEIQATGHADLLEDENGNWWLVFLGIRRFSHALLHNLGRETFLTPVVWTEAGWPVVGNHGLISTVMDGPLPGGEVQPVNRNFHDNFSDGKFKLQYNFLRNPEMKNYKLYPEEKMLCLEGTKVTLNETKSPTWIGIRQKGFYTETVVKVSAEDVQGMRAGLTAFYNDSYHYEIYLTREQEKYKVCLAKHIHDIFVVTASAEIPRGENITLRLETDKTYYTFSYSLDGENFQMLGTGLTVGLCTESTKTMTFTGTYIGLFAENGRGTFQEFNVKVLDE